MDPTVVLMVASALVQPIIQILSGKLIRDVLFGGEIDEYHKTKFAVEKFVTRYGESIDNLNRALMFSVAFVPIALLPLPAAAGLKIPLIDLSVTNQNWLRVCPAISYGLQMFTLVALVWFLIMRRGLDLLKEEFREAQPVVEYFGDVSNIMLTGVVGSLWMFASIRKHIPSQLHLFWFIPLGFLVVLAILSPSILCGYFIRGLFLSKDLVPALIYCVLLVPSVALSLILMALSVLAGSGELALIPRKLQV